MCTDRCNYTVKKVKPESWNGERGDEFFLDDDPEDGGLGVTEWQCPHPVLNATKKDDLNQHCVFHTDPDIVPDEIDEGDRILQAIETATDETSETENRAQFIGATFGSLDLSGASFTTDNVSQIRFDHTEFRNSDTPSSFTNAIFRTHDPQDLISFHGATFSPIDTDLSFEQVQFKADEGQILFTGIEVVPEAGAESPGGVLFNNIDCIPQNGGSTVFEGHFDTIGDAVISFESATFRPSNAKVRFSGIFDPDSSPIEPDAIPIIFDKAEFLPGSNGTVEFSNIEFRPKERSGISFDETTFDVDYGEILFINTVIAPEEGAQVSFDKSTFNAVTFNAEFRPVDHGIISFINAEFDATAIARDVVIKGQCQPRDSSRVTFADATFRSGHSFANTFIQLDFNPKGTDAVISFENAQFIPESVNVVDSGRADLQEASTTLVSFSDSNFNPEEGGTITFRDSLFKPNTKGEIIFNEVEFTPVSDAEISFANAEFVPSSSGEIRFEGATFSPDEKSDISFTESDFHPREEGVVSFENTTFRPTDQSNIIFAKATFETNDDATVTFDGTRLTPDKMSKVSFEATAFRNEISFKFDRCEGNISFNDIIIVGLLVFPANQSLDIGVTFSGADFSAATLPNFNTVPGMMFKKSNFTDVNLSNASFRGSNVEQAIFTRANIYGADFTGARIAGTIFEGSIINHETNFGQIPTADLPSQFEQSRIHDLRIAYDHEPTAEQGILKQVWYVISRFHPNKLHWNRNPLQAQIIGNTDLEKSSEQDVHSINADSTQTSENRDHNHSPEDDSKKPNLETIVDQMQTAAGAYQTLESIARENALTDLQSKAFVRRQEMNRKRYATEAKLLTDENSSHTANASEYSRFTWLRKWVGASVSRIALFYGESFGRIISVSFLFILAMSVLYPLFGWFKIKGDGGPIRFTGDLINHIMIFYEGFYFSTLTFTTLGMGDYIPVGFGQVLATINTALGAIMIALLVFVLGRRAAR